MTGDSQKAPKPITMSQRYMLARAGDDWAEMPPGVGCTNGTLAALEKRGLIETRLTPGQNIAAWFPKWEWRKTSEQST